MWLPLRAWSSCEVDQAQLPQPVEAVAAMYSSSLTGSIPSSGRLSAYSSTSSRYR